MENNENSICASCGKCCKSYAGFYEPNQVLSLLEDLKNTGTFKGLGETHQIDWYEGSPDIYMIRPAHKNSLGRERDPSWGGECVNLTDTGCSLTFEQRPLQCQALTPSSDFRCKGLSKRDIKELWKDHQNFFL